MAAPAARASWWAVGLYPAAWLFQTAVGDALHQLLHFCSRHGTLGDEGRGAGAGAALRRLLGCIGYIHTCHHSYIDAFGNVDPAYQWQNIWLDKVLKRAIHQGLALGCWRLLLRPLAAAAPALAAAGRRAMLELVLLEGLRTAWAVWLALPSRAGKAAAVVSADHPSLSAAAAAGLRWHCCLPAPGLRSSLRRPACARGRARTARTTNPTAPSSRSPTRPAPRGSSASCAAARLGAPALRSSSSRCRPRTARRILGCTARRGRRW